MKQSIGEDRQGNSTEYHKKAYQCCADGSDLDANVLMSGVLGNTVVKMGQ